MKKRMLKSDQNSIDAMKLKEHETADAAFLFQQKKQKNTRSKHIRKESNPTIIKNKWLSLVMKFCSKKLMLVWLILLMGFCVGLVIGNNVHLNQDDKQVAFRIGESPKYIDYDLLAAINFLKYTFERNGYKVAGVSYMGNLYPEELDHVGVNVFVRGFAQFFDLRMNEHKTDILYIHRNTDLYAEELKNFDMYLFSQQKIMEASPSYLNAYLLPIGFVPHEQLVPQSYEYDILYIYEHFNDVYVAYMQQNNRVKIYSGSTFAELDENQRAEELKKAKVVVYDMENTKADDKTYIPYAVFDLISYGRPVVTHSKLLLSSYFNNDVWLFDDVESMILVTNQALNSSDNVREQKALKARKVLYGFFDMNVTFFKNLKSEK